MRCRKSPLKRHMGVGTVGATIKHKRRKGYMFRRYSKGNRGHSWQGHGKNRVCSQCSYKPSDHN